MVRQGHDGSRIGRTSCRRGAACRCWGRAPRRASRAASADGAVARLCPDDLAIFPCGRSAAPLCKALAQAVPDAAFPAGPFRQLIKSAHFAGGDYLNFVSLAAICQLPGTQDPAFFRGIAYIEIALAASRGRRGRGSRLTPDGAIPQQ
jgi:hypothetical protein